MMMETILSRSLRLMFSGGVALSIGLLAQPAFAQQVTDTPTDTTAAQPIQRVEITGSSIKRIQKEGALPVQVLTAADIKKTGATSVTDLIQNLPAMQGFATASTSVNGGGGGVTTAALHSLASQYTLVLLDGVRVATQGGAVNLESIPLDAIERVEILTDGASALYGSDAIAGVVNFILKKNKTDGDAYLTGQDPQHSGGRSWSAGVSKGFGDLDKDNFNVLLSYSHDTQKALEATQRSFSAQGGLIPFTANGKNYLFNQSSINSPIANLDIISAAPNDPTGANASEAIINPYALANAGSCGSNPNSYAHSTQCRFNYAATVQDIPSSTRDSGLAKATFKIDENTTAWATMMVSRYAMTAQYAASAQPFAINSTNLAGVNSTAYPNLFATYVQPYLNATGTVITGQNGGGVTAYYRTVAMGGRTDDYQTDAHHFSAGITSTAIPGWDLNAVVTLSNSVLKDTAAGGYGNFNEFNALVLSGAYDPVMNTGGASLQAAEITGQLLNKTTSNDNSIKVGAQHNLFEMPGGTSIISLGADFNHVSLQESYDPLQLASSGYASAPSGTNAVLGGTTAQVPFDASRNNVGLFGEWLLPLAKTLEGNIAGRYDSYSKVYSGYVFQTPALGGAQLSNADLGDTFSKATYKLSLRFTPTDTLLLRASYGTGFKAPSLGDIAATPTYAGSTAGSYSCPFPATPASCAGGLANPVQYDLLAGGNSASGSGGLKAENSKQWTLGFRVEPGFGLTAGADLWNVQIKDQVLGAGIPEATGFASPQTYSYLFTNPYTDPVGHYTTIGYSLVPLNGGVANYQGIDWDFAEKLKTPVGPLSLAWNGTYMMKQNYTFQQNGPVLTDLGAFGPDNSVVFRVQMHAIASLTTGNFTNSLTANYKSGYHDESYLAGTGAVKVVNADGSTTAVDYTGQVGSYTTFDWQGRYDYSKVLNFTAGIKNLFDKNPPLSLVNAGGGNQVGYDGRYADPLGRAFYLTGHYHF
ncbi:TonB-dependent receptor domain-containing protein [Solimicrobium silvestre]|uniref:TonB dependent receptor n=1 Tax=Solimicrobium silvestre TaxID=2099400 RepID=A0A2S9H2K2_9BURK|nr:TonB-dependent receptor [Solimicrobium silvestre]PRC94187.1 TonB dependent receptor [Solimicrobium silvestre]